VTTVGLILVGNELLTGKIRDENGYYLAQFCFNRGALLKFVIIVPDEKLHIAAAVNQHRTQVDLLITSGGVGPTHDDITYESIAHAFAVNTQPEPSLIDRIQLYFGARTTAAHLKMGYLPENATLNFPFNAHWPTVSVENVYIFPGVPHIFQAKLKTIADQFQGIKHHLTTLQIKGDEGTIADLLAAAEVEFGVAIGSYPVFGEALFNVRVTIEGPRLVNVEKATNHLVSHLSRLADTVTVEAQSL
jgi:FAD synthetase